jgi:hypothetical protein
MNEQSVKKENLPESRFHDFNIINRGELFSFNEANEILSHFFSDLIFSYFSIKRKVQLKYYSKNSAIGLMFNDPDFKFD